MGRRRGRIPRWAARADINGDGKPDIAVTNEGDNNIGVLLNNGDGTFGANVDFPADEYPLGIAAGRFHGNKMGNEDVIVTNNLSATANFFFNKRLHACR